MKKLSDPNVWFLLEVAKTEWGMGEILKGSVAMNIIADSPYCLLKISFYGQEEAYFKKIVRQTTTNDRGEVDEIRTRRYEEIVPIESFSYNLKTFEDGIIEKGQYLIPFQFLIPMLPAGSAYCSEKNQIRYKLRATLVFSNLNRPQRNIQAHRTLDIIQTMRNPDEPGNKIFKWENVFMLLCCHRGKLGFKIQINKVNFYLGDQATIRGKILNQSKSDVSQIKVYLKRTLTMQAEGAFCQKKEKMQLNVLKVNIPQRTQGEFFELVVQIPQNQKFISFHGKAIQNKCQIKIKAITSTCTHSPKSAFDVKIFRKINSNIPINQPYSHPQFHPIRFPLVWLSDPIRINNTGVPPGIKPKIQGSGLSEKHLVNENL